MIRYPIDTLTVIGMVILILVIAFAAIMVMAGGGERVIIRRFESLFTKIKPKPKPPSLDDIVDKLEKHK